MVTISEFIAWIFVFLVVATIYWYATIPKNLPPGPLGLPFIGSSIDYRKGSEQELVLLKHIKKYGPIFKMYIANKLVVILGDYDTIQEALIKQGDIFVGRPQLYAFMPDNLRNTGVIFSEGDLWKEHRRFALSTLRDFGVGRPLMEERIKDELDFLSERITEYATAETSFNPQRLLICAAANVISLLIFGRRFSYDDEEFVHQFEALSRRAAGSGIGFLSPFLLSDTLSSMMSNVPYVKKLKKEVDEFMEFTEREVKTTAATFDPDSEPSNYIHAYMKFAHDQPAESFTDMQLLSMALELFMAGTESTSTTIRWAILYLAHFPEIQEKMHQEIKDQVGTHSWPNVADRVRLPFCDAVIMEIQRISNLVPFGVFRRAVQPTKLMGYDIPEDTLVMPFLTNVLLNPNIFVEPTKFDPYRFLDSAGKVVRDPRLIPFQAGKRICLGEPLARMELFLLLTGLIGKFRFFFPQDQPKPTLKPITGLTSAPVNFSINVDLRND